MLEYFLFALGQGEGGDYRGHLEFLEDIEDAARDAGAHRRTALGEFAHSGEDLVGGRSFEDISFGPGLKRVENLVIVFIDGKHAILGSGAMLMQEPDRIDTAGAWEADINNHDIRGIGGKEVHGIFGIDIHLGTGHVFLSVEYLFEMFGDIFEIFDDRDLKLGHGWRD